MGKWVLGIFFGGCRVKKEIEVLYLSIIYMKVEGKSFCDRNGNVNISR